MTPTIFVGLPGGEGPATVWSPTSGPREVKRGVIVSFHLIFNRGETKESLEEPLCRWSYIYMWSLHALEYEVPLRRSPGSRLWRPLVPVVL